MCNNTLSPSSPASNSSSNSQPQHTKQAAEQVHDVAEQVHPPHQEEEYIDYSCSTAVERLTRDVESLLRTWHVDGGCDRHVSLGTNPDGLTLLRAERLTWIASLPQQRQGIRMELELALWDGPASQVPPSKKSLKSLRRRSISTTTSAASSCSSTATGTSTDTGTTSTVTSSKGSFFKNILDKGRKKKKKSKSSKTSEGKKKKKKKSSKSNRRSSVSNDECLGMTLKVIEEASLALQDDITMDGSSHTLGTDFGYDEEDDEERERHSHLPKSLQRPVHPLDATHMPDSLFDNFSTLFGIGQHITLTPTNPNIDLGINEASEDSMDNSNNRLVHLCKSLLGRHKPAPAREVLTQLLATWLQTALNCAAMNCQSCIPVFGLWGQYPSASLPSFEDNDNRNIISGDGGTQQLQQKASINVFPPWMDAARALQGPITETASALERDFKASKAMAFSPRRKSKRKSSRAAMTAKEVAVLHHAHVAEPWIQNSTYAPPILTGSVIPTTDAYANFTCSVLPQPLLPRSVDQLSIWGDMLSRQCGNTRMKDQNQSSVVLSGARHVYAWRKDKIPQTQVEDWRGVDPKEYWKGQQNQHKSRYAADSAGHPLGGSRSSSLPPSQASQSSTLLDIEDYQSVCRSRALLLLEHSMGEKCWGPREDPIYAMHATVVWKSTVAPTIQALGSFPSPTHYDSSSSLLNPQRASSFRLKTFVDHEALEPTLATTQRCVLACLVRASTLAPMTLLNHLLWEEDIVEDWDHEAGNQAAMQVARQARLGEATQTLVDVMDWKTCAEESISMEQAEKIVQEVLEGTASYAFPSPPEDMFSLEQQGLYNNTTSSSSQPLLAPLFQSAPVGRLLSDLCARMAQLRTPCSMALVWNAFCNELRQRWDAREPLPHMNFVPGLDPSPTVLSERRRKVTTIGVKADLAAFLNCSEADPDDQHCLIGQKLQVFNIGIEVMSSIETLKEQTFDEDSSETSTRHEVDEETYEFEKINECSSMPARATSVVSLVSEGMAASPNKEEPSLKSTTGGKIVNLSSLGSFQLPDDFFKGRNRNKAFIDEMLPKEKLVQIDHEEASIASDSMGTDFFDAEECGMSIFSQASLFSKNLATTVVHRIERKGARCPLHGCSLVASGDQVYAPYLLRPEPITDDMILDRRMMLSEEHFASEGEEKGVDGPILLQQRLEIAYRLQKPKLLSDMKAFKAANPGAIFQDFVSWYGNPGNPLEDYSDSSSSSSDVFLLSSNGGLAATELDKKATDAIHILNETRNFWSSTWDEASAIPASEQKPLFDVFSTVEITLDYLENMHPAILLSQVLAVNFTNAYFQLVASAKDTVNVKMVESSIQRLRTKTEEALKVLAKEASNATNAFYTLQADPGSSGANFISTGALSLCEEVCAAFSEAEIIIALVTSILQKLPGQYDTAQNILKKTADGDDVELPHEESRGRVLDSIRKQQAADDNLPTPVLREYLLRNLDDANPCQLSVRYGDDNAGKANDPHHQGGLMIALTRTLAD